MDRIEGHVDCLRRNLISGWYWNPDIVDQRLNIQVVFCNQIIAEAKAEEFRPDLAKAGKGDGCYSFTILLDPPIASSEAPVIRLAEDHSYVLYDGGWVEPSPSPTRADVELATIESVVEHLGPEGVQGWAWSPLAPTERVIVEALLDERVLAGGIAEKFRGDLLSAGKGDGAHGFKLEFAPLLFERHGILRLRAARLPPGTTYEALDWHDISIGQGENFASAVRNVELQVELQDHRRAAGWAWNPSRPNTTLRVEAVLNERVIAASLASNLRSDLYLAGKGTGRYGFDFSYGGLKRGRKLPTIRVVEELNVEALHGEQVDKLGAIEGHIDYQNRRLARGWAWRPTSPEETVIVEARAHGKVIGRTLADEFRRDLLGGNKGNGCYGFTMEFYEPVVGVRGPEFYVVSAREEFIAGNLPLPKLSDAERLRNKGQALEAFLEEHEHYARPGPDFENLETGIVASTQKSLLSKNPLILAFYLPQFHAIPENDQNWGHGFTEWRQLARALPRFPGHYQPRIPRDLGFYDLTDTSVLPRQAELAKAAGVGAFCYYYYWFNGKRVLDIPLNNHLRSSVDLPFAIMWTNENWTRTWDGSEDEVLLRQDYREEHEDALLADLARHFRDKRYVRLDGRPLFFLYNPRHIPKAAKTITRWRKKLQTLYDLRPLFFMAQTFETIDPTPFGFDGAIEFPPHKLARGPHRHETPNSYSAAYHGRVIAYDDFVDHSLGEEQPDFPLIKTAVPSWDNEARRPGRGLALSGASPSKYQSWLRNLIDRAIDDPIYGVPIVAVNAWNEWAEAAYLEPDVHYGSAYLNATARALADAMNDYALPQKLDELPAVTVILPCYNHGRFLQSRIKSILDQTVPPKEIIFLDDASSDSSVAIAENLLRKTTIPWRIEVNETNSGSVFKQWMKGIELAKHELVWIAETDDSADPGFLANLLPAFRRGDVLGAYGHIQCIDGKGNPRNDLDSYYHGLRHHSWDRSSVVAAHASFTHDFAVQNIIPNASGFVFRKPKLDDRQIARLQQYRFAGDWYFYALVLRGGSLAYRRKAKSFFRVTGQSASRDTFSTDRHLQEHCMILEDLAREYGVSRSSLETHALRLAAHFPDKAPTGLLKSLSPKKVRRRMRICVAAHSFSVGGAEMLPLSLANRLKEMGHHITYLVMETVPAGEPSIRTRLRFDIPVVHWSDVEDNFEQFLSDFGIDVLNSHNVGVDYHLFRLKVNIPCTYISSLHGGYETVPELLDSEFIRYLHDQIDSWLYLAERNRRTLLEAGLRDAYFVESYNAVDSENINWEDRQLFRSAHRVEPEAFSLVICSRAIASKGWETCAYVMKLLNAWQDRPVHLFLIGDGPDLPRIRARFEEDSRIHFLGHVDTPVRLLPCFDLAILPSVYAGESFPLFLLESLTAGLPIVSTDIGDIPKLIGSYQSSAGALVSAELDPNAMAEAMARLVMGYLQSETSYLKACENARRISRNFTLDKLAAHYLSVFRKRIAAKRAASLQQPERSGTVDVS